MTALAGIALGLAASLACAALLASLALGIRGRISSLDYDTWIRSPAFAQLEQQLAHRRGSRSAVTGIPAPLGSHPHQLRAHHWTYGNVGRELLWQLVLVTKPEHDTIHDLSVLWFGHHTRGLWATTAWVVGWGKLTRWVRAGGSHRPPPPGSASPQAPMQNRGRRPALPAGPHPPSRGGRA